jgi:hypothetical protein
MALWNDNNPPILYPNAVSTPAGWADPITGELYVTITDLSTAKGGTAELTQVRLLTKVDPFNTGQSLQSEAYAKDEYMVLEALFNEPVTWPNDAPQITANIGTTPGAVTFAYYQDTTDVLSHTADKVTSVTIGGGGTNYQVGDKITFTVNTGAGHTGSSAEAVVTSVGGSNAISGIAMTSNGAGYDIAPTAVVHTGYVKSVTVGGSQNGLYVDGEVLSFTTVGNTVQAAGYVITDGTHTKATVTTPAVGNISSVVLTNCGVGYTGVPTVTVTSALGSGVTLTAVTSHGATASLTAVLGTPANGKGTNRILFRYQILSNALAASNAITLTSPIASSGTTTWTTVDSSSGADAAASAVVASGVTSYTMTAPGSGYTSTPTVQVTSATGTGATAVAVLDQGIGTVVGGIAGSGYRSAPVVTVTPATGGAAVTAVLGATGIVCDVAISGSLTGGTYTNGDAITVSGGTGAGGFAGTIIVVGGDVTGVNITNAGVYSAVPTLVAPTGGGSGTGRVLTAVLGKPIASYIITPGTGYTNATTGASIVPTLSVAAPTATSVTTTASVTLRAAVINPTVTLTNLQTVASVQPVTEGSGYVAVAAAAVFSGGGGTLAAATPVVSGEISSFVVTNGGSGYYVAPTVTIGAGVGSGATATATIDDRGHVVAISTNGTVASVAVSGTSNLKYIDGEPLIIDGNAKAHLHVVNTVTTNSGNGVQTITAQTITVVVDSGGSGYTSEPKVYYPLPGEGAGLTFTPVISGASGGSGYIATLPASAPIYTSQAVSFTPVASTPTLTFDTNQYVSGVTIAGTGTGYENGQALVFSTGAGAGTITVNQAGNVVGAVITNGGDYDSAPTITIAPPPTWVYTTTYSKGNIIYHTGTSARYVSLQNSNQNNVPGSTPLFWTLLVDVVLTAVMGSKIVGDSYVDGVAPTISSASILFDRFGDAITQTAFHTGDFFTVTFNTTKPVFVVGSGATSVLGITTGAKALTYFSGSGSQALHFTYQLVAGDVAVGTGVTAPSPIILASGTTIKDVAGNNLVLSFNPPTTSACTFN